MNTPVENLCPSFDSPFHESVRDCMKNIIFMRYVIRLFAILCWLNLAACAFGEEAPRAPQDLATLDAVSVPGPGANLVRNGSFEGSHKYAAQAGEWRIRVGREAVDETTAVVGKYSLTKAVVPTGKEWNGKPLYTAGFEFAPFHCKWDRLYCVSFFAKADTSGAPVRSTVRGMHHSDNDKYGHYPVLEGEHRLSTDWQRFHYFFPANRLKNNGRIANSYYVAIGTGGHGDPGCRRIWIDGLQVEEVEGIDEAAVKEMKQRKDIPRQVKGYPTHFKLYAPVEVCAEAIDLPPHNLYTPQENVAQVRAAIVCGEKPRTIKVTWRLLDHRRNELWVSPPQEKTLQAGENWLPVQDVALNRKGAMLVRVTVTDNEGTLLNYSDEPVTVLPFDLSRIGNEFDERFGINMSFASREIPPEENVGLNMLRRVGFRWVRIGQDEDDDFAFAEQHGFNQFVTVFNYPKLVREGSFPQTLPADQQWDLDDPKWDDLSIETQFDKALKEMASRYKGKVEAYQFGNETTHAKCENPKIPFRVCRRAAKVIRSVDPEVKIIGASIIYQWKIDWWKKVIEYGGLDDMDYFGWDWDCYVTRGSTYDDMMKIREVMKQASGGKEVMPWNYETGWGSGWMQDYPADPIGGAPPDFAEIPDQMARCFARIFGGGNSHFILHLTAYQENLMGAYWSFTRWPTQIYDEQERPRVTLAPYNVAIRFLGLSEYHGRVMRSDWGIEGYAFTDRRENRPVLVYWSTDAIATSVPLPLAIEVESLETYDVMGNVTALTKSPGETWSAQLLPSQKVLYLVGPAGASPQTLIDGFEKLPELFASIPTFEADQLAGTDKLGGRWEFRYLQQEMLAEGKSPKTDPTQQENRHVWAKQKRDGKEIELGGHGRADFSADYGYAACLAFTPPAPGTYTVSSKIDIIGGTNNKMRVIAGILNNKGKLRLLGQAEQGNGNLPISTLFPKGTVDLKEGETLIFGAYRTSWHWYGTAKFQNLRIRSANSQ